MTSTSKLLLVFLITAGGTVASVNAIVQAEYFLADVCALGVGLGYALANSMFGGTAPLIYQAFMAADNVNAFIVYVTVIIAVSLVGYVFFLKNRAVTALDWKQRNAYEVVLPVGARSRR